MVNFITCIFFTLFSGPGWSRSLKVTADKLADEATRIGIAVAVFGIVVAAIFLMLGRNDGSQKMTSAILGTVVVVIAPAIVGFIKTLA